MNSIFATQINFLRWINKALTIFSGWKKVALAIVVVYEFSMSLDVNYMHLRGLTYDTT